MSGLKEILKTMEYEESLCNEVLSVIATLRQLSALKRSSLEQKGTMNEGMMDEIMYLKKWYVGWKLTDESRTKKIEEVFTLAKWEKYLIEQANQEFIEEAQFRATSLSTTPPSTPMAGTTPGTQTTKTTADLEVLNISYKVEAKEIPKLPPNKNLKGDIFNDWHSVFHAKMCQAQLGEMLKERYKPVKKGEPDYQIHQTRDAYLKNHLLTATIGTNAISFINAERMTGVQMYQKLLAIYQGDDNETDSAVIAASTFEKLVFARNSRYSPEKFLSKVNECLKRMETSNSYGGTVHAISPVLLPNVFRAKVTHPAFDTWKQLSEKHKENWDEVQLTFLQAAEKQFKGNHEKSDKFRVANQKIKKKLSEADQKAYEKALSNGERASKDLYKKLDREQKEKLHEAIRNKKKQTDGGLGSQYNINNLQSLPSGTVLVPCFPQGNQQMQTNNANLGSIQRDTVSTNQTPAQSAGNSQLESNEQRALNFLQLANGNYVVRNAKFQFSSRVSAQMSVQSFHQKSKQTGFLWIDGGTNVSAMGRTFRLVKTTGRYADMTGFANNLVKKNVPIGSGLTKCIDKMTGFEFLLGLHESPYLENNHGSLLSTNQTREAGIWLSDILHRHGGDQRLVAPIEGQDYMLDMQLEVQDGLLGIECSFPSDQDLDELPRVWLTSNETPWDPSVLDNNTLSVVPCWDGHSEFTQATDHMNINHAQMKDSFLDSASTLQSATFMIRALGLFTIGNAVFSTFKSTLGILDQLKTKVLSPLTKVKKHDYEAFRPMLGWLPLETIRRTFDCTTQLAMGSTTSLPFRQHHKS